MIRAALLGLVVLLALGVGAAPATAQTSLLLPEDAVDLTNELADAQAEQGFCYGYVARINGVATDVGSSTGGPGQPLDMTRCARGFALLEADLTWTCDSCEAEDSASVAVQSSLPDPPDTEDFERLGIEVGDLVSDNDDVAFIHMVAAMPLLVAEKGAAEPVAFDLPEQVPAADRPTNSPGSDFLRQTWPMLVLFGFLFLLGPLLWWRARRST